MLATGVYDTLKSTTSIMDVLSAQVIEYISHCLSFYMVLTLKDISGRNILVSGDNKERLNGALKVVISSIFSSFSIFDSEC